MNRPTEALRVYAKSARKGLGVQNRAAEIKILAEQRGGKLLAKIPREQGKRGGGSELRATLARSEIPTRTAHRWQTMAAVPEIQVRREDALLRFRKEKRD